MGARLFEIAERALVAREIVMERGLFMEGLGAVEQKLARRLRVAEFVQTICRMDEARRFLRQQTAELLAKLQRVLVSLRLHENRKPRFHDRWIGLHFLRQFSKLRERQLGESEFAIALCGEKEALVRDVHVLSVGRVLLFETT